MSGVHVHENHITFLFCQLFMGSDSNLFIIIINYISSLFFVESVTVDVLEICHCLLFLQIREEFIRGHCQRYKYNIFTEQEMCSVNNSVKNKDY